MKNNVTTRLHFVHGHDKKIYTGIHRSCVKESGLHRTFSPDSGPGIRSLSTLSENRTGPDRTKLIRSGPALNPVPDRSSGTGLQSRTNTEGFHSVFSHDSFTETKRFPYCFVMQGRRTSHCFFPVRPARSGIGPVFQTHESVILAILDSRKNRTGQDRTGLSERTRLSYTVYEGENSYRLCTQTKLP